MDSGRLLNVMKMRALQIRMKEKARTRGRNLSRMKMLKTYAARLTKTGSATIVP